MSIWFGLLEALGVILRFFHDITVGLVGDYAWVAAIILLTMAVRVVMLPLAVKQFRSMQAMQELRPQMKRIQQKYKTDRGMMRTDPEKYRERRQKQQEELMALYKERDVNPASSCLPLIAQMPIFVALFSVLRSPTVIPELKDAPFFGSTLQANANEAGIVAIALLVLMGVTTYVQQKQMMGRNAAVADDQAMQQQKIMLYVMPVFLTFLGFNLPVGVLVYWVTTNLWQMTQQWFMLREIQPAGAVSTAGSGSGDGGRATPKRSAGDADSGSQGRSGGTKRPDAPKKTGRRGGPSRSSADGAKRDRGPSKSNGAGDSGGNGHRPDRSERIGKARNKKEDKRR